MARLRKRGQIPRCRSLALMGMFSLVLTGTIRAADVTGLTKALGGADAVAEARAREALVEMGDGAVAELAKVAVAGERLPERLMAVELMGRIGTRGAMEALLEQLKGEKNLAVRGQICMQLGYAKEKRAVPILIEWLKTIGPRALDDVQGPKEVQPSTCYLRHLEALGMIGEESAAPAIKEFAGKIPKGIGYGGFVSNFVGGGVDEALANIADQAAFWGKVRRQAGLEEKIGPLMVHFRTDRLAKFRMYEDQVIRHTEQGREIVRKLTGHKDAVVAGAAKELLGKWEELK